MKGIKTNKFYLFFFFHIFQVIPFFTNVSVAQNSQITALHVYNVVIMCINQIQKNAPVALSAFVPLSKLQIYKHKLAQVYW